MFTVVLFTTVKVWTQLNNGVLFTLKKENHALWDNTDEPRGCYSKLKKPIRGQKLISLTWGI